MSKKQGGTVDVTPIDEQLQVLREIRSQVISAFVLTGSMPLQRVHKDLWVRPLNTIIESIDDLNRLEVGLELEKLDEWCNEVLGAGEVK